jgi:branched-subunit amino acid transport protein
MTSSSIVLIIIITSIATYISRVLGVLTSERLSIKSKIFSWFNYVAYSILAALISRMIIFPAGALLESTILIRLIVITVCVAVFVYSKKNLVLPTMLSFILLTLLSDSY